MAYRFIKTTVIIGYNTAEENPYKGAGLRADLTAEEAAEMMNKSYEWGQRHMKSYSLNGHWSSEAIRNFAARRNLHNIKASHHDSNTSKPGVLNSNRAVAL